MNFATAFANETKKTFTENGAPAYNTTDSAVLNLFGSIGSLREADDIRIERLFADAYTEDPLLAMKCLFYARNIRGGLGERETFRTIIKYVAKNHPDSIRKNLEWIPFYGRYDDFYTLIDTPVEDDMWKVVKETFETDLDNMNKGWACSLLAKWLKTADASSKKTREIGIYTAHRLGYSVYEYKRKVRALRKYIDVVEVKMSARQWNQIKYPTVPSKAMTLYRNAFSRHDAEGFSKYIEAVSEGKEKINASVLYPYDICHEYGVHKTFSWYFGEGKEDVEDPILEAQWKALPNYVPANSNAIVVADTSGSMTGRPMEAAVALAIYFAERNTGAYHGLWMSFSSDSRVQRLQGETLLQKIRSMDYEHWGGSTNLEAAFENVLKIAVDNRVHPSEMVKDIIVISDMEIDEATTNWRNGSPIRSYDFHQKMKERYEEAGYTIPGVVFWNVNSRHDIFHVDKDREGVILCSGQSASTFQHVVGAIDKTPYQLMLEVLNDEQYQRITV